MAQFELVMPKLGESIEEATITKWFVKEGDTVDDDDVLLEIATDKVDSEIPSPVAGKVTRINFKQDDVVAVGTVIAVIDLDGGEGEGEGEGSGTQEAGQAGAGEKPAGEASEKPAGESAEEVAEQSPADTKEKESEAPGTGAAGVRIDQRTAPATERTTASGKFLSPLVKNIAARESISEAELDSIEGSGNNGRVRKQDLLKYLSSRKKEGIETPVTATQETGPAGKGTDAPRPSGEKPKVSVSVSAEDEVIEMDRIRKLIAEHMVMSKRVSPHVTNMLEADVTDIVLWRNRIKDEFQSREKEKITYLPIFLEQTIRALRDFPMINASVDGDKIILRKHINLGIAVALPAGNLIVPVIRDANQYNLLGLTKALNQIADRARNNKLGPDDIQGGTFTISNFGTFRNVMGTPIINQPQVAILAIGTIEKKPAVIETPTGDIIGIRHKMFVSLTYDHRIIDGAYGGAFLRKLADYFEDFDMHRSI